MTVLVHIPYVHGCHTRCSISVCAPPTSGCAAGSAEHLHCACGLHVDGRDVKDLSSLRVVLCLRFSGLGALKGDPLHKETTGVGGASFEFQQVLF